MTKFYTNEVTIPIEPLDLNPDGLLSSEEKQKAAIVGRIIEAYTDNCTTDVDYGELFDRFFEKSITELVILDELAKR